MHLVSTLSEWETPNQVMVVKPSLMDKWVIRSFIGTRFILNNVERLRTIGKMKKHHWDNNFSDSFLLNDDFFRLLLRSLLTQYNKNERKSKLNRVDPHMENSEIHKTFLKYKNISENGCWNRIFHVYTSKLKSFFGLIPCNITNKKHMYIFLKEVLRNNIQNVIAQNDTKGLESYQG